MIVRMDATIESAGQTFSGFIGNLSEKGIHMNIVKTRQPLNFKPGDSVQLKVQLPSEEVLILSCLVKWLNNAAEKDITCCLGMEVIQPPDAFLEFLKGRVKF